MRRYERMVVSSYNTVFLAYLLFPSNPKKGGEESRTMEGMDSFRISMGRVVNPFPLYHFLNRNYVFVPSKCLKMGKHTKIIILILATKTSTYINYK